LKVPEPLVNMQEKGVDNIGANPDSVGLQNDLATAALWPANQPGHTNGIPKILRNQG